MKLPLRIENEKFFDVIANQSEMEMLRYISVLQENIARDLHDDLSQYITTMTIYISGILSSNKLKSAHHFANEMKSVSNEMNDSLKILLTNLRGNNNSPYAPRKITNDDYHDLLKKWESLNSSISLKQSVYIPTDIDDKTLSQCYQILSEALINISRHANAKQVLVNIGQNENAFQITVSDDGIGFNTTNIDKYKFGLLGMKERANKIGASITLNSAPNHGSSIHIHVPLE